jgi:hypothetical protein
MRKLSAILSFSIFLLFSALAGSLPADIVEWYEGDHEIGVGKERDWISELHTYNDVTVTIYEGGGVGTFKMYDNSSLTSVQCIAHLYLYDNATASFSNGISAMYLNISPSSTGWVKLYAYDVTFNPSNPFEPYGEGEIRGKWLANDMFFSIDLFGDGAYSHIQIVPEPATLLLFGLGGLVICRRKFNG